MVGSLGYVTQRENSSKTIVSGPTDFQHKAHIGLNADGTLDVTNIPDEWKTILKQAGIKKKEMNNPEINKVVVSTLSMLAPTSGANHHPPKVKQHAKVKFDFASSGKEQLTVNEGETVAIVQEYKDGWTKAQKPDGSKGMVPSNYLEKIGARPQTSSMDDSSVSSSPMLQASSSRPKPPPQPLSEEYETTGKSVVPTPAAPAKPQPPPTSTTVVPPARPSPVPPRPTATPPTRASPPARPPQPKRQPATEEILPQQNEQEPEPETEHEPIVPEPENESIPQKLAPRNPMLAGIEGFNKTELKKSDSIEASARPVNPLLASIQGFDKNQLKESEQSNPPAKGNFLAAINNREFSLRKVEKPVEQTAPAPKQDDPLEQGIAGILKAKLAHIRVGVVNDDDNDSDDGDWSE